MWGNRVITINTGTGDEEGVCCSQPHDDNEKEAVRSKQERWLLALLSQEGVLAGTRRAGSTDGTPGSDGVMSGPTRTVPAPHAWRGGAFRSVARTASDHGQHRWLCAGPSVVDGRGHCPCLAAWECVAYICSMNVITLLFPSQAEPPSPGLHGVMAGLSSQISTGTPCPVSPNVTTAQHSTACLARARCPSVRVLEVTC